MPALRLRHAVQALDFGEDHRERAALAKDAEVHLGMRRAERLLGLRPYALGDERVALAARDQSPHELRRLRRDREAEFCEACGEARHAQDADGVLDEGVRDVAQKTRLRSSRPPKGSMMLSRASRAMALIVRSRRRRSCSSVTSGAAWMANPR
jgi:hypothetical protein